MLDRVTSVKLKIKGVTMKVVICYVPQVGGEIDEKEKLCFFKCNILSNFYALRRLHVQVSPFHLQ